MPYVAPFPLGYNGRVLQRGQVIEKLDGCPNDQLLVSMNLLREASKETLKDVIKCDNCGISFMSVSFLHAHRRKALCGISDNRVLDKDAAGDSEVLANLPESKRKDIIDLG